MGKKPAWCTVVLAVSVLGCQNCDWTRNSSATLLPNNVFRPGSPSQQTPNNLPQNNATGWNLRSPTLMPAGTVPNGQAPALPANAGFSLGTTSGSAPSSSHAIPVQAQPARYGQHNPVPASHSLPSDGRTNSTGPASPSRTQPSSETMPNPDKPAMPSGLNYSTIPSKPDTTIRTTLPVVPAPPGTTPSSVPEPVFPPSPPNPPLR
ncbi:MAG: hypothetical protein RMI91_00810 [Gemmatales bacterium]|nr:hypothetical protein [Gemmatales bacterium]MDW7993173.1 hypothetical protein [Gemmatales bacterium]